MKNEDKKILNFIKENTDKTPEEIKKALNKEFTNRKFDNEETVDYIIEALSKDRKKTKSKNSDYER